MISDFLQFLRHFLNGIFYVRGVLLALLLLLSICVAVFVLAEDMPLSESIYLTLITSLSIGYGDIVPVTTFGRVASVVAGIIGVISIGLTVAIATRALTRHAKEKKHEEKETPSD